MAYPTNSPNTESTYKLRGGYDKTTIVFMMRREAAGEPGDSGIENRAVLIRHHHDQMDPSKFVPHFNLHIDGYETQVHCNVWVTPEFAAKVWEAFTKPFDPHSGSRMAWERVVE
jgi:hypothetical protein